MCDKCGYHLLDHDPGILRKATGDDHDKYQLAVELLLKIRARQHATGRQLFRLQNCGISLARIAEFRGQLNLFDE